MASISDPEFGEIIIRRSAMSRAISIRLAPNGKLRASLPTFASERALRRMIDGSRDQIARLMAESDAHAPLRDGQTIGKSHTLVVKTGTPLTVRVTKSRIDVTLPDGTDLNDLAVEAALTPAIIKVLRQEARAYLPRRLDYLATQYGFHYETVRFSHASSRWGSCSSRGTISLNIALMKLPFELIDYVVCHELSHLHHMNHSAAFWDEVARLDPRYREHRRALKAQNPGAYV